MCSRAATPEPVRVIRTRKYSDTLYDLLTAYSQQRIRVLGHRVLQMVRAPIYLIEEARARIERVLGEIPQWALLVRYLPRDGERERGAARRSRAHSLAALELARDGRLGDPPDGAVWRDFSERPRAGG